MGEKGEGLPGTTGFFLQHGSHIGIRRIRGQGKDSRGNGMMDGGEQQKLKGIWQFERQNPW